jgi:hypothetical protein
MVGAAARAGDGRDSDEKSTNKIAVNEKTFAPSFMFAPWWRKMPFYVTFTLKQPAGIHFR